MTENSLRALAGNALIAATAQFLFSHVALAETSSCAAPAKAMARLELVFGLGNGRTHVGERAWNAFVAREVTPRFPAGFTFFDGRGQWRDAHGAIEKEASRLLLIWHAPEPGADAKIEAIRTAYKKRFHQQSVLRADGVSCVSF